MALLEKQKSLDEEKWIKSEKIGHDACGEFDYCKYCNKDAEYPCATAHSLYEEAINAMTKAEKPTAKKTSIAKKTSTKKSATKKTTTKKSTTKKIK